MVLLEAKTQYGWLRGKRLSDSATGFFGIAYAQPPVEEKRWTYPVRPACWDGIRSAECFGSVAPQGMHVPMQNSVAWRYKPPYDTIDFQESEDCLYLNLWTPAGTEDAGLPVLFWIPGGGFTGGHPSEPLYSGEAVAKKGVILVAVQHRLGALGFLSHPMLEAKHGHSGNYALYDLLAALDWVQENIAAFGGNPGNVTIAGQSSGCVAVQTLLQCPLAKGKFRRAIMQSGRALESGDEMDTSDSSLKKGEVFIQAMGAKTLEDMYRLQPDDLFQMQRKLRESYRGPHGEKLVPEQKNPGRLLYHTEEGVMPELLDEAALLGINADVDILIGSCLDDGGPKNAAIRGNSAMLWCQHQIKMGNKPSYLYLFARRVPGNPYGAHHSAELPYQFGNLKRIDLPYQQEDYRLSDIMLSYWTNFARSGDPNGEGLPVWKAYTQDTPMRMRLDTLCQMEYCFDIAEKP